MAPERLSRRQRCILAWSSASIIRLVAKAEMTGTIGRILPVLENSEEILVGKLTREGRNRVAALAASCE